VHSKLLQLEHNHCHKQLEHSSWLLLEHSKLARKLFRKRLEHSKLLQLEHNHCHKQLEHSSWLQLEHSMKLQLEHSTLAQRCNRSRDCS
jgi:hypothetical protein